MTPLCESTTCSRPSSPREPGYEATSRPAFHFCCFQHKEMGEGVMSFLVRTSCKSADGKNEKATCSNNTYYMYDSHLPIS